MKQYKMSEFSSLQLHNIFPSFFFFLIYIYVVFCRNLVLQLKTSSSWTLKGNVQLSSTIQMTGQRLVQSQPLRNLCFLKLKRQMHGQKVTCLNCQHLFHWYFCLFCWYFLFSYVDVFRTFHEIYSHNLYISCLLESFYYW